MRLRLFFTAILLISCTLPSHASSIVLDSVSGGTYTYGLDSTGDGVAFEEGDTITLTGLSGVTGVTAGPIGFFYADGFFSTAFTSTSVTLTFGNSGGIIYPGDSSGVDFTPFFSLTSTSTLEGLANFNIDAEGVLNTDPPVDSSGQVNGPVAAATVTPEPSTFALIATGMACIAGINAAAKPPKPSWKVSK